MKRQNQFNLKQILHVSFDHWFILVKDTEICQNYCSFTIFISAHVSYFPERRDVICHVWVGGWGLFLSPSTSFPGKCPWRKVAIRGGATHHTYIRRGNTHHTHIRIYAPLTIHIHTPLTLRGDTTQPLLLFRSETASLYMVANYTYCHMVGYFLGPHLCCWNQSDTCLVQHYSCCYIGYSGYWKPRWYCVSKVGL